MVLVQYKRVTGVGMKLIQNLYQFKFIKNWASPSVCVNYAIHYEKNWTYFFKARDGERIHFSSGFVSTLRNFWVDHIKILNGTISHLFRRTHSFNSTMDLWSKYHSTDYRFQEWVQEDWLVIADFNVCLSFQYNQCSNAMLRSRICKTVLYHHFALFLFFYKSHFLWNTLQNSLKLCTLLFHFINNVDAFSLRFSESATMIITFFYLKKINPK